MGIAFFRTAGWLEGRRLRAYMWLLAIGNVVALALLVLTARGGVDRFGHFLGTDFLGFWAASATLHAGATPYDVGQLVAHERMVHADATGYVAFFYPPVFLLYCWPLALAGYFPALLAWLAATGGAFVAAIRAWAGRVPWLAGAAFPPVMLTIGHGQTAFLSAALIGGGLSLVGRRPLLAGVLLGLATFKPQFGVLIPLVLVLTGAWRTIAAAAVTAAVLAAAASLAFGAAIWSDWLALSGTASGAMADDTIGYAKMVSPFAAARLVGLPEALAWGLQGLVALAIVAALVRVGWRARFTSALASATMAGALLVTPFALDYDLVLLVFPLLWLAAREPLPWDRIVLAAAFALGAVARPLAMHAPVPIAPFVVSALFAVLVRHLSRERGLPSRLAGRRPPGEGEAQ